MCVYSLVVLSCLFFAIILMKPTVVICPDTPLANESLVQSANERSVWRDGGIWITPAAGRVNAGEFLCHIWLPQAKCCWLEKYPSSLHWIGESIFELWNCAWLLSPGPSGKRHFPEQYMTCYWYSVVRLPSRHPCAENLHRGAVPLEILLLSSRSEDIRASTNGIYMLSQSIKVQINQ